MITKKYNILMFSCFLMRIIICESQTTITSGQITQSENSVSIDRTNPTGDPTTFTILNSNNSSDWDNDNWFCGFVPFRFEFDKEGQHILGADWYVSTNGGQSWYGSYNGLNAGSCDPNACIDQNGTWYSGSLSSGKDIIVSYSLNHSGNWTNVNVTNIGDLDKPNLYIDNKKHDHLGNANPNTGNLYCGWTDDNNKNIEFSRSIDHGITWSPKIILSNIIANSTQYNHGVNIKTGPNGEVYACWATFNCVPGGLSSSNSCTESGIAFASSLDGGIHFSPPRIIQNISGIFNSTPFGHNTMKLNSLPVMAVNQLNGDIFIVWTQNTSSGDRAQIIKSIDGGNTFSLIGNGNVGAGYPWLNQFFPWIACDETSGALAVICYATASPNSSTEVFTFVCYSYDEGVHWNVNPAGGLAWYGDKIPNNGTFQTDYAGDYLGIDLFAGYCVPAWSDDATNISDHLQGQCPPNSNMLAYVSPFSILCNPSPWTFCSAASPNDYNISDYAFYQSQQSITAGGTGCPTVTIQPSGYSTMQASTGGTIFLEPGFTATAGSYYHASISGCTEPVQRLLQNSNNNNGNNQTNSSQSIQDSSINKSNVLSVLPNPSTGLYTIMMEDSNYFKNITISDMLGRIIYQNNVASGKETKINLTSSAPGVYILRSIDENGKQYINKLIKN